MQGRAIGPAEKNCQNKAKNRNIVIRDIHRQYAPGILLRDFDVAYSLLMLFWCDTSFVVGWSKLPILPGLEPGIPWFVVRCLIHWATGPKKFEKNEKVSLTKYANLREIIIKLLICATGVRCVVARCRKKQKKAKNRNICICARFRQYAPGSYIDFSNAFFNARNSFLTSFYLHTWLVKTSDPARTRTWNPLIRSQMPYPLGHRT